MKKTFVIASTADRFDGLCTLIRSLSVYLHNGWDIAINFQKYDDEDYDAVEYLLRDYPCEKHLFRTGEYNGCSLARIYILERVKSDIWCSLDDDMEITPLTNYERMVDILTKDKTIGFISSNWALTENLARKKKLKVNYHKRRNISSVFVANVEKFFTLSLIKRL